MDRVYVIPLIIPPEVRDLATRTRRFAAKELEMKHIEVCGGTNVEYQFMRRDYHFEYDGLPYAVERGAAIIEMHAILERHHNPFRHAIVHIYNELLKDYP
jgi:hypothetical protein